MRLPIERIKLSQTAKNQLIRLKTITKIEHWNILCRWAFCRSLAEPSIPAVYPIPADSNLEMTWQVFGGDMADILLLALKQRCYQDGFELTADILNHQFRLHLHRGIGYLMGDVNIKKIDDLMNLALK
jgi:DNA sulfur modification protein DndE